MRELHVASNVTSLIENNTADFVFESAANRPEHVALRRRVDGAWCDVTAAAFAAEVTAVAKGLIAAGIDAGDRVAVMSKTRYEWTVADFALFTAGAVVVPIYETSSAEQVEWILADSGAKGAFVETRGHAETRRVGAGEDPRPGRGVAVRGRRDRHLDRVRQGRQRRRGHQAPRVGVPRRSGLDHLHLGHHRPPQGLPAQSPQLHQRGRRTAGRAADFLNEDTSTLLFLPIAHVFGRAIEIGALASGCTLGHTPTSRTCSTTSRASSRRSCSPCRGCSRRSTTARSSGPTPAARARSSTTPRGWRSPSARRQPTAPLPRSA